MSTLIARTKSAIRWPALRVARSLFTLVGRDWNSFYAWMLDFQDRKVTLDQILARQSTPGKFKGLYDWQRGDYYVDFMERHGVRGDDRVLDIGCGYGRVTIPLLKRQDPTGVYFGTEISQRRLDLAQEWIERERLSHTNHELVHSLENSLPFIGAGSIDVVWVLSVFNHMPDRELDELLDGIARVLRPGGKLFCYFLVEDYRQDTADSAVKTFRRTEADMSDRLTRRGFALAELVDFDSDIMNRDPMSRMWLCTKRQAQS